MRNRYPRHNKVTSAMLMLALSVLPSTGCIQYYSGPAMECSISGPIQDSDGTVRDPNLYLTHTYPKPAKVTLRDSTGRQLSSWLLSPHSRFKIGIAGEDLVGGDETGGNTFAVPVSATAATTVRHKPLMKKEPSNQFTVFLHVETDSQDTVFKMTVDLPE